MTTIQDLPEEILRMIFGYVGNLKHCQPVCHLWYLPAHTIILKEITIFDNSTMERFIRSIDLNPHPAYLRAIKKLKFDVDRSSFRRKELKIENVKKLLFRFPSIKEVCVSRESNLIKEFNDELCNAIIQKCPKLDTFAVEGDCFSNFDAIHKVRLIATSICLLKNMDRVIAQYGTITQFVSSFPRLKEVVGFFNELDTFQSYLPIFEQLPDLISITLSGGEEDVNSTETYLTVKSKEEQELLLARLSKVESVNYERDNGINGFNVNTIKLISKYFTGLKNFTLTSNSNETWFSIQKQLFCNNVLDLFISGESSNSLVLKNMDITILSECLPTVVQKVSQQTATHNRILEMTLKRREKTFQLWLIL